MVGGQFPSGPVQDQEHFGCTQTAGHGGRIQGGDTAANHRYPVPNGDRFP